MAKAVEKKTGPPDDEQLRMANAQIVSMVRVFIHFLKYLLSKCIRSTNNYAGSVSNYSHINPIGR